LNGLPDQAAAAAQELLSRRQARTSLTSYLAYLDLAFAPAAHHRLMIRHLEDAERGTCTKLMLFLPPGSGKSFYASQLFPAWYIGRNPDHSIIAASHTQDLADRFGRRVRNLVASEAHRNVFGVGVAADRQAAGQWETESGGEYFAVGIGGSVTGRRANLGIIDDPVRGREDADSERARATAWEWYVNDFTPRLKPGASQILIMTRWHQDDLAGRLLDREAAAWRVVELPMEARPGDPLGREPGARLWPEWFTEEMVATAKRDPRAWNALYQQQPVVEEGDYFKLDWFLPFVRLPPNVTCYGASDYAVSEGGGDYTEHGVFGVDPLGNLYVLDWWRGQTAPDAWIDRQCDLILRHQPICWFGEKGVIEKAVRPYLTARMNERRAYCRVEWLPSVVDKAARCRGFQAMASMGKVLFPIEAPWKAELIGQLTRFPAGKHDDAVDVCSLIGRGLEQMPAPSVAMSTRRGGRSNHLIDYNPYAAAWDADRDDRRGRSSEYDYNPYGHDSGASRPSVDRDDIARHVNAVRRRAMGLS
jgi:predicted phage terminase large subunit-like protein